MVVAGAVLSAPVAMLVVSLIGPQPAWSGVDAFAAHYHPIQALPYILGYLLLAGFTLFTAACHARAGRLEGAGAATGLRARTGAALVFTAVYAALVLTNYTLQVGYVPRILAETPDYLAALTMANPASFAWFLEMFGYAALGVATWLVAPVFPGRGRARWIRGMLRANGVLSVVGAACTAAWDAWVFSPAGMVSFAGWNLLIVLCFGAIAMSPARAATGQLARGLSGAGR